MAVSDDSKEEWESYYREYAPDRLPWETGRPDEGLVELVENGEIKRGRVLDICSGLGTQTIYLARKGFEVYGIDISPTAVNMAEQRCRSEGVVCNLTQGDAVELGYPDGFFTFVFDRGCFHSVEPQSREEFIKGVHRVVKKGGRYFMICFSSKNGSAWNHFTEEDIRRHFSRYFKIIRMKEELFTERLSGGKVYLFYILMETL